MKFCTIHYGTLLKREREKRKECQMDSVLILQQKCSVQTKLFKYGKNSYVLNYIPVK